MYDMKHKMDSDNGNQKTMYHCDGSHHEYAQPTVDVPMVEDNEYPLGMKPMEDKPKY